MVMMVPVVDPNRVFRFFSLPWSSHLLAQMQDNQQPAHQAAALLGAI